MRSVIPLSVHRLTCAAVITAVNWLSAKDLIETFGTIGLILVVFVESGLLPVPLPGDSILRPRRRVLRHDQARRSPPQPRRRWSIGTLVAAVVGAQIGYAIGSRYGTRLFKPDARIFKTEYLERAQEFFDRRGPAPW